MLLSLAGPGLAQGEFRKVGPERTKTEIDTEAANKSGQNIPKNRCRTTIAEPIGANAAVLPFIGDLVVCLSHDQAG